MRTVVEGLVGMFLLVLGGGIYLLFRPQNILMFKLVEALGLSPDVDRWREMAGNVSLPDFVVYCLPNGLWAAAYIMVIDGWLYRQTKRCRLLAAAVIPLVGATAEVMQTAGWIPGTFDYGDIACMLVPLFAYAIFLESYRVVTNISDDAT
ncbi:MAG: hypothetical protein IKH88_03835 [Prevotella sp.]|nr:hypothetical protein [Prevotella sp.]